MRFDVGGMMAVNEHGAVRGSCATRHVQGTMTGYCTRPDSRINHFALAQ